MDLTWYKQGESFAIRLLSIVALFCLFSEGLSAQESPRGTSLAVKTNALYWASSSPNLGFELGAGRKLTVDVSGGCNPFTFSDGKKWKHWLVRSELRWWFCEKFNGHFLGVHAVGGEYNLGNLRLPLGVYSKTQNARYEGWGAGGGVSYGYQWVLSRRWSFEATIGAGYIYSEFDKYPCAGCGSKLDSGRKHYFGLTRVDLNLIYVF